MKAKLIALVVIGVLAVGLIALVFAIEKTHDESMLNPRTAHTVTPLLYEPTEAQMDEGAAEVIRERVPLASHWDTATLTGMAQAVCTDYRRGASFVGAVHSVQFTLSLDEPSAKAFTKTAAAIYCTQYESAGMSE